MTYRKENITINGTDYKRITKVDSQDNHVWQKDISLVDVNIHASGGHLIFSDHSQNRFYHFKSGSKWREYSNIR